MYTPHHISAAQTLLQLHYQTPDSISTVATTRSQTKSQKIASTIPPPATMADNATLASSSSLSHTSPRPGWVYPENGQAYYVEVSPETIEEDWEHVSILEREASLSKFDLINYRDRLENAINLDRHALFH